MEKRWSTLVSAFFQSREEKGSPKVLQSIQQLRDDQTIKFAGLDKEAHIIVKLAIEVRSLCYLIYQNEQQLLDYLVDLQDFFGQIQDRLKKTLEEMKTQGLTANHRGVLNDLLVRITELENNFKAANDQIKSRMDQLNEKVESTIKNIAEILTEASQIDLNSVNRKLDLISLVINKLPEEARNPFAVCFKKVKDSLARVPEEIETVKAQVSQNEIMGSLEKTRKSMMNNAKIHGGETGISQLLELLGKTKIDVSGAINSEASRAVRRIAAVQDNIMRVNRNILAIIDQLHQMLERNLPDLLKNIEAAVKLTQKISPLLKSANNIIKTLESAAKLTEAIEKAARTESNKVNSIEVVSRAKHKRLAQV